MLLMCLWPVGYDSGAFDLMKILLETFTEMSASTVADGTKRTSGMFLIMFSWGTFSPAFLAAMAAGGISIPANMVVLSARLSFTFFSINSINSLFLSVALFQLSYSPC